MPKLRLVPVSMEIAPAAYACMQDIPPENGLRNDCFGHGYEQFLAEDLPAMLRQAAGEGLPDGYVPQTTYILMDDDVSVGMFKLRHRLSELIRTGAGHISYGVCSSQRGKGYATAGLALMLDEARHIVPEAEAYMNVRKANPASLRVMQKNGAVIHHENEGEYFTRIPLRKELNP